MSETKVGLSPENFCRASREFERLGAKIGAAGKKKTFLFGEEHKTPATMRFNPEDCKHKIYLEAIKWRQFTN
jgi:hypothetical protein